MTDTWACSCCGLNNSSEAIVALVEGLRRSFPGLMVTNGTRCRKHNREVGGSRNSAHLPIHGPRDDESEGADVTLILNWNDGNRRKLVYEAITLGAQGVGVYSSHVHIDLKPRRQLWSKRYGDKIRYFFV